MSVPLSITSCDRFNDDVRERESKRESVFVSLLTCESVPLSLSVSVSVSVSVAVAVGVSVYISVLIAVSVSVSLPVPVSVCVYLRGTERNRVCV